MKLTKECFIHNRLAFDSTEKDVLILARKIVEDVRMVNIHSSGAEDNFLTEQCNAILNGIDELLDNYANEYPNR